MQMTMRKKMFLFLASAILIHFLFIYAKVTPTDPMAATTSAVSSIEIIEDNPVNNTDPAIQKLSLYDSLHLNEIGLSRQAFDYAYKGFTYLQSEGKLNNDHLLSIVDFSQPSSKKRLYVLDLQSGKVLFNTYVSHGRNSGREMA